jgi:glycosyltransferase involved in cell wall biosynthesis
MGLTSTVFIQRPTLAFGAKTPNVFCSSPGCPPEKGAHVLIKAFKILAESRPDLRLDLVGSPGLLPYLYLSPDLKDAAIRSLNSFYGYRISEMVRRQLFLRHRAYRADLTAEAIGQERIVFHGAVSQIDTVDFYRRATVFVLPSVWHKAFGGEGAAAEISWAHLLLETF